MYRKPRNLHCLSNIPGYFLNIIRVRFKSLQIRNWGSITLGQYKTEEEDEGVKYVPLFLMQPAPLSLEDK